MTAAESYPEPLLTPEGEVYKTLFENSPLPMWIYDLETLRFMEVNDAAIHRYGYSRSEFLSMTTNDLRPAEEHAIAEGAADAGPVIREWRGWRHRLKNGEIIEVEITTQGLRYKGRRAAFVIISGLTERRELRPDAAEDGRFQKIFENAAAAMVLLDPESGEVVEVNRSAVSFYGYTTEKMSGLNFSEIVVATEADSETTLSEFIKAVSGKRIKSLHRFAGGEEREVFAEGAEISLGEQRLICLTIGKTKAEPTGPEDQPGVPANDLVSRELLELASSGYYRTSADGSLEDLNTEFAAMLGYTKEELLSDGYAKSIYVSARDKKSPEETSAKDSGSEVNKMRKKNGEEITVEDNYRYVSSTIDGAIYREGFCREVMQESGTAEMKRGYESILMDLSDLILIIRKSDYMIVEANKAAESIFGLSHEGLLGRTIFDLSAGGKSDALTRQLEEVDGNGAVFENIFTRGGGSPFPVEIKAQLMRVKGKELLVVTARDDQERKEAESALRQNEEKYRTIFEKSPVGIMRFDSGGIVTECNESLASIMSSPREYIIGLKLLDLPNKDLAATIRKVLEGKLASHEGEYRSFTASKAIHVRATFTPIASPADLPSGGIAIFEDISERGKVESALRESEKRYRLLYESSPVPYHLLDAEWKIVEVNASWMDLLGYSRGEVVGKDFIEFVSREHAAKLREALDSFRSTGVLGNIEVDVMHKTGDRFTVAIEGRIVREPDGKINQSQFMLYDITERKMAENALKESEEKFRNLAESASSAIFMYQNNKVCYVNAACVKITGYDSTELLKMNFWDIVHPDFRDLVKELGMARQRGEPVPNHFELKIVAKSGDVRWVDFTAATASYKGELAVLGTAYDVTERKSSRNRLEESEEQRRLLVEKSPDGIMILTDGKIVYLNPSALKLLEADSPEQLVGKSLKDVTDQDSLTRLTAALNEVKKSAEPVELHGERLQSLAGGKTAVDMTAASITYLGKRSIQLVARMTSLSDSTIKNFNLESQALKVVPDSIVVTDKLGKILWANRAFQTLSGYSILELNGRDMFGLIVSAEKAGKALDGIGRTILDGNAWHDQITCRRKDSTSYTEDVMITPVSDEDGSISHLVWVQQDSMMRKMFEEQLLRAKKLEGIGQLVSSVVHDYNNILGVILGHGELLRKTLKEDGPARVSLEAILNATRKGTDLARQLLDFGEEGAVTTRAVDVNKVIKSMEDMFLKTIGEKIGLDIIPLKDLWLARVDPIHLYEMLINLATNARDAIVEGPGTLLIKTSNVVVDENFVATHSGFSAGEYVMITFSDNGMGMDKKTRGRIFEPFFTTKDEEHSPGLGLAAVYGMVKRNGGGITVRSTPGDGTTFCIYLPRFDAETSGNPDEAIPNERLRSDKTILVVEDQTDLLGVIKHDLEEYGYRVLSAPGPEEALDICEEYPGEIDLLLSDVILPGINGRELSDKIADILPNIKTVFMSGYSSGTLKVEGVIDDMAHFLQKPFTSYELGRKMFKVING